MSAAPLLKVRDLGVTFRTGDRVTVASTEVSFDLAAGVTPVPGGGYSLGTGLQAYHFVVDAVDRMSTKTHLIHTCRTLNLRVLVCGEGVDH